jgi:hypothetical protein
LRLPDWFWCARENAFRNAIDNAVELSFSIAASSGRIHK